VILRKLSPLLFLLAACTAPHPTAPLAPDAQLPPPPLDKDGPGADQILVATFSGGGTRAAALAQGALNGLKATPLPGGRTMLDEIDILSSTSGGSVTAANFVARGPDSFAAYEADFLRYPFMGRLYAALLNPVSLVDNVLVENDRIEPVVEVFEDRVFGDLTLGKAQARPGAPYMILNATDAASGLTFAMTQDYFDWLCADARPYPLARAVAASAAYPVALSPVTLANRCAPAGPAAPRPETVERVGMHLPDPEAGAVDAPEDVPLRERALRAKRLIDGEAAYVHLYDGGVADNMGLSEPLRLLTTSYEDAVFSRALKEESVTSLALLSVDARSAGEADYDRSEEPPTMLEALLAVTGGAIGSRMSGLAAQSTALDLLAEQYNAVRCANSASAAEDLEKAFGTCRLKKRDEFILRSRRIFLSFNNIAPPACRRAFASVPTSWSLEPHVVTALLLLGEGLLYADPDYGELVARSDAPIDPGDLAARGEALVEAACGCVLDAGACPGSGM
jgi:NTE family protein